MEEKLKALFDFQRFAQEKALSALIHETEARYTLSGVSLPDDWLESVAAAGEVTGSAGKTPSTDDNWKGEPHQ